MSQGQQEDESKPEKKMYLEGKADAAPNPENSSSVVQEEKACENSEMTPEALQELILERKAERKRNAEEKRQEDLKRIAEMRSRNGIHPIDDLFPEEIWIKILTDKDLESMDRYNMRQVHPVFLDLLEATKIQDILLPLALNQEDLFPQRLTKLFSRLSVKEILTLRLVSKGVRDSVDKYIEERLLNSCWNPSTDPNLHFPSTRLELYCEDPAEVLRKISAFTSGPIAERPKRFLLKSLHVDFAPPRRIPRRYFQEILHGFQERFQNFKAIITELLEQVGDQILFFQLRFDCMEEVAHVMGVPMPEVVYRLVRDWLLMMPNLMWIDLHIEQKYSDNENIQHLNNLTMPKLDALEGVFFSKHTEEIPQALVAVLVANPHLKYFTNASKVPNIYLHPAILPLALEDVRLDFRSLRQINTEELNWNLKGMTLQIHDASLDQVFLYLQQNFPNLRYLYLDITGSKNTPVGIGKELGCLLLPNLEEFWIRFGNGVNFTGDFHFFFALHFLLRCGDLRELIWINWLNDADLVTIGLKLLGSEQSERLIDFQGDGGVLRMDMRESTIWDVFPQLRFIQVQFQRYWYEINERRGSLSLHSMGWNGDHRTNNPEEDEELAMWE